VHDVGKVSRRARSTRPGWRRSIGRYGLETAALRARDSARGSSVAGDAALEPRFAPACMREGSRGSSSYHRDDGDRVPASSLPLVNRAQGRRRATRDRRTRRRQPLVASFDRDCAWCSIRLAVGAVLQLLRFYTASPGNDSGMGPRLARTLDDGAPRACARREPFRPSRGVRHETTPARDPAHRRHPPEGGLGAIRALRASAKGQQAFTPRSRRTAPRSRTALE